MLDFMFESPRRFLLNEIVSLANASKTERAPVDRRQSRSSVPRKRRRNDGLYSGPRAPLEW